MVIYECCFPYLGTTAHERVKTMVPSIGESNIEGGATMYAIIETGGKQVKCEVGSTIFVEKLDVNEGDTVEFDKVVCYSNRTTKVGTPYVKGAKVVAKVEKQGKGKKIIIFKYKCKNGSSHRKQGHRQPYTKLTVEAIEG